MSRADEVLAAEYEVVKGEVLRTVGAKLGRGGAAEVDLEAAYNEAWHALYMRLAEDQPVDNRVAFLVTVTYRRALSERRASRPEQPTAAAELEEVGFEPDVDARLDAELQVRQFVQGLRTRLDQRELRAATLTYVHGLSRPEAAKVLGVSPRRMEKLMDRASKRIASVIETVRPGELCEQLDSPVRAFAVGLLDEDGERYAIARDHLETCPACRRKVLVLRGLGAIAPPLPGMLAVAGTAAAAGVAGTGLAGAGKAAGGNGVIGKLGAKAAALGHKGALIGGAVTATTAVAAVATVAAVSGGGHHEAPKSRVPVPAPKASGPVAGVGGTEEPALPTPIARPQHSKPHKAKHKHKAKSKHQRHEAHASAEDVAAPQTYEPAPEAPAVEPAAEPAPVEATPEPAPEPPPAEPVAEPEPTKPATDAAVEFELR